MAANNLAYILAERGDNLEYALVLARDAAGIVTGDTSSASHRVPRFNGLRVLNVADGETVWEFHTETSLYAAPNVHDGTVLIAAESGQLFGDDAPFELGAATSREAATASHVRIGV